MEKITLFFRNWFTRKRNAFWVGSITTCPLWCYIIFADVGALGVFAWAYIIKGIMLIGGSVISGVGASMASHIYDRWCKKKIDKHLDKLFNTSKNGQHKRKGGGKAA
jgi:hypothetical protein